MGLKEIEGILVYYKDELRDQSEKYSILMAEDIYVEHVEWLISHIKELEEQFKFCGMRNIIGNARENAACKRALQAEARIKELEGAEEERHRLSKLLIEARTKIVELREGIEKVRKLVTDPDYSRLMIEEELYKLIGKESKDG